MLLASYYSVIWFNINYKLVHGFDPGPEWTLELYFTHASRTGLFSTQWRTSEHFRLNSSQRAWDLQNESFEVIPNFIKRLILSLVDFRRISGSRGGNGSPSLWCVVDFGDWSATSELRQGPSFYGGQQWRILGNGGNSDPVRVHAWWRRVVFCKVLSVMKIVSVFTVRSAGQLRASSRGKTEGAGVIRFDWV